MAASGVDPEARSRIAAGTAPSITGDPTVPDRNLQGQGDLTRGVRVHLGAGDGLS